MKTQIGLTVAAASVLFMCLSGGVAAQTPQNNPVSPRIAHDQTLMRLLSQKAAAAKANGTASERQGAESWPTGNYAFRVFYTFIDGTDGGVTYAGVVGDRQGNLYGTTTLGGDLSAMCAYGIPGCGVVYKLDPNSTQTVLHDFTGGLDGGTFPFNPTLILDEAGNLYGSSGGGGVFGYGNVFEVQASGNEVVLYSFTGGTDGNPNGYSAPLLRDEAGNLYGTTSEGGNSTGCGVVYKIEHSSDRWGMPAVSGETVLYAFQGGTDGCQPDPFGSLIRDDEGNLYGTTIGGGPFYNGTVYKLDPSGKETVLYSFTGGTDGGVPFGGLVRDKAGNLYGVATVGGDLAATVCSPPAGCGAAFKLDPSGKLTVLHAFTGLADGGAPYGGPILDAAGNLYGTTYFGGTLAAPCYGYCGVVYKLDPAGNETVLYSFPGGADGNNPYPRLFQDGEGDLYGTTSQGGDTNCNCGTVFKLTASREGRY